MNFQSPNLYSSGDPESMVRSCTRTSFYGGKLKKIIMYAQDEPFLENPSLTSEVRSEHCL